jgi:hypothetical protein
VAYFRSFLRLKKQKAFTYPLFDGWAGGKKKIRVSAWGRTKPACSNICIDSALWKNSVITTNR